MSLSDYAYGSRCVLVDKRKFPVDSRRVYPAPFPFATYLQAIRDDEKPLVTQRELRKLSGDISLLETSLVS